MNNQFVRRVTYNCQVCGMIHRLRAKWDKKSEEDVKKFHGVDIETVMLEALRGEAKRAFLELHPGEVFDKSRLGEADERKSAEGA